MKKLRIVAIEAAPGAKPEKVPRAIGAGHDWRVPVVYVLADGRRVEGSIRRSLKRDAVEKLAKLPRTGIRNMSLEFLQLDDGRVTHVVGEMFGGEFSDSEFSDSEC